MAEFVKKTMIGYYKDVPGGASDPECTHVILTDKEYTQQLQKISVAEQEARNTKYDADRKIRQVRSDAQSRVSAAETEADQRVKALEQELAKAQKEAEYQRGLNANLLRISRERANADRKLKPKKEHPGYVVAASDEKEYRYRDGKKWKKVKLWETVLQSPYTVDYTEEQARTQITRELFPKGGEWPIGKIGITGRYGGVYERMFEDSDVTDELLRSNILLAGQQRLRANFRAGYWELVFMHTKPLRVVPPDMRVR